MVSVEGECVGVNNGSHDFDEAFEDILDKIEEENNWVAGEKNKEEKSAVRIALMTTLTPLPDGKSALDVDRVRAALEGAYVAQMRVNHGRAFRDQRPLIQLYLANEGSLQQHWELVVDNLVSMSEEEEIPLLAVVGPGVSTSNAEKAATKLSKSDIPMVSAVITADDLNASTIPGLIRVSPSNSEYVDSLFDYFESEHPEPLGALIYNDTEEDTYTATMRESYRKKFKDHLPGADLDFTGKTSGKPEAVALPSAIDSICAQIVEWNLNFVLFAGREDDLYQFVETWAAQGCHSKESITIGYASTGMADDEEFQENLRNGNLKLAMASSTHPGWSREKHNSPTGFAGFEAEFDEHVGGLPEKLDNGFAIMHHDAVVVAVSAVRRAEEDAKGNDLPLPEHVRTHLTHLHGDKAVSAAGGELEYTTSQDGNPVGKWVTIVLLGGDHGTTMAEAGSPQGELYVTGESEKPEAP